MDKRKVIWIFAILSCTALCADAGPQALGSHRAPGTHKSKAARKTPAGGPQVRDGFSLTGIDGELSNNEGKWFFEFDSEVSDGVGQIDAGEAIELLPSTALEKIIDDAQRRSEASYRLWGHVTKYKDKNFIFPIYFLPISSTEDVNKPGEPQKAKIAVNEPNDELAMPEEIVSKLKNRRVLRQEQLQVGLQLKQDYVLADRTAILVKRADGQAEVILDAIGRNIPQISIRLLPCEVLELAQQVQSIEPDPVHFKIAGIITQYKGEYYLLLQKAIRAYSHENFGG
jgi:hypothetical protein